MKIIRKLNENTYSEEEVNLPSSPIPIIIYGTILLYVLYKAFLLVK